MSKEYFNNGLFKKMVELHNKPNVEIVDIFISRYDDEMSDIKSTENSYYLYYDINGNYLGDKETDLIKKQINTPIDSETETNNDQDNDNNNKEETPIVSPYQESVG